MNQNVNLAGAAMLVMVMVMGLPVASIAAELEEVTVTAQKRVESIQDVPISISALDGENLRDLGMRTSKDLSSLVPNLEWVDDGSNVPQVFIRGIGDISFHLNQQGGVGLYMDEVSLSSPALAAFPLFDLERVEVLRGPQNTLFGRNTTGGAIQFISKKPNVDDGLNGQFDLSYGSLDTFNLEAAVGAAVSDSVAFRIAVTGIEQADWMDNVTTGRKQGGYDQYAARGQLLWRATDDIDVLFNLHGGDRSGDRHADLAFGGRNPADPTNIDPDCDYEVGNGCADSTGFVFPDDYDTTAGNLIGEDSMSVLGGFLNVNWALPSVTVTSVTSYDQSEQRNDVDSDGGPNNIFYFSQDSDVYQWSQEIRLASNAQRDFRWIAGAYYFFEDADWVTTLRFTAPPLFAAAGPQNSGPQLVPATIADQENEVWSVYGQGDFLLTDQFTFTLGLRYTGENKQGVVTAPTKVWTAAAFPADRFIGEEEVALLPEFFPTLVGPFDETWDEVGGKISLDYQYSDDLLYYASVSKGFKGGGTSLAAIESFLGGQPGRVVDPESLWSYELGAKSTWMDGALRLNGAVFYNDWQDQQLFTTFVSQNVTATFLVNVPESSSYGAEIEMEVVPSEGWFVAAGLSFLHAQVDKAGADFPGIVEGASLPNSPDFTLNGLVRKEWRLRNGVLALQTSFNYKDSVEYSITENPVLHEDSYWLVNVRGSYRFGPSQQYEVAVFGENLTDAEYCKYRNDRVAASQFGGVGTCASNYGEPIFGAAVSVSF